MLPVFRLSLRQMAGRRRLLIIIVLAALPVAVAATVSFLSRQGQADAEMIDILFDGLIVAAIVPLVMMALATAAFGNELEDRTLSYLVLKPVRRSLIVLPKILASLTVGGSVLVVSGVASALLGLDGSAQAATAVGVAVLAGVVTYAAIFTWAGLLSTSALAYGLIYVFIWEALIGSFFGGIRYLSVRGYTLAIMHWMDEDTFAEFGERAIELPAAIGGVVGVTLVFLALSVFRLRRMDVP